jgi:uncharacterized membrane protein YfcA
MPSIEILVLVVAVFGLAGWVKGVVGMGLPTVAMGGLGLVMHPVQAAALLIVPSLVTNVWQFAAGPAPGGVARRLATMLVFACIGTAVGIRFLVSGGARWPTIALGSVLAAYALLGLLQPRLSVPPAAERRLSPVVGGLTGLLAGATGVFVVPAVPYLSALGFSRDELVQALGLAFTVSTIALGLALGVSGSYPQQAFVVSLAAVAPALLGMFAGQALRARIEQATFRRWFFVAMLAVGAWTVFQGLVRR